MDQVQLAILRLLQSQAVGSTNAMSTTEIFNNLTQQNLPLFQGTNQDQIRSSVRSMINKHGQLIGTNSGFGPNNGYFMIETKEELLDTIKIFESRSQSMLERVDSLKLAWNTQNPNDTL